MHQSWTRHAHAETNDKPLCPHDLLPFCTPKLVKRHCYFSLTSQAAAVGRVYFSAIYFESPAPRHINVGRFLYIDYVWGSGAWDAEEVGDVSTVEASLTQGEKKIHHTSILLAGKQPYISAPLCSQ